jgi:hypothetical protein
LSDLLTEARAVATERSNATENKILAIVARIRSGEKLNGVKIVDALIAAGVSDDRLNAEIDRIDAAVKEQAERERLSAIIATEAPNFERRKQVAAEQAALAAEKESVLAEFRERGGELQRQYDACTHQERVITNARQSLNDLNSRSNLAKAG